MQSRFPSDRQPLRTHLVPAHAFTVDTNYGRGWECERGYRTEMDGCVAVKVPGNGYLDDPGDSWKCEHDQETR